MEIKVDISDSCIVKRPNVFGECISERTLVPMLICEMDDNLVSVQMDLLGEMLAE